jgi:hypothetical protein
MPGTPKRIAGPAYLAASATNIYTPAASTINYLIKGLQFTNKDSVPRTFTIYVGATGGSAGGTELIAAKALQAGETYTWYAPGQGLMMVSTDFLTGIASAASAIVITVIGETITNYTA